ncbi:hypothetical protein Q4566_00255 [Tamlana sp. 2_MG-2023]|uniref:hypothetical protein n=1 Tax=unclassified Tamlana TaxID=2614803 RepID=UPI0026E20F4F|nr:MULTISPECIES: hypothetical protein [unclassified Tamlana]MDO6758613.1 hypothetical protein [Tamlana sp. 2_MG-2023]MDO6789312.1 hypothetical protein [Tamlana sp. 1_MG-2023]
MKNQINALLLALTLIVSFTSCDQADELTEFDVTETFDPSLSIDVPGSDAVAKIGATKEEISNDWNASTTIDISDNDEINDNLKYIEKVKINSLDYKITNYSGPDNTAASNVTVTLGDVEIALEDVILKSAYDAGKLFSIEDPEKLNAIANKLKQDKKLTISSKGTVNNGTSDVDFEIQFYIKTTFTIDAI